MSNSKLVNYTKISPNSSNPRNHKIDTITIHHTAGVASVETLGNIFAKTSRKASCNYGIGSDGRVALIVDEANRSWCSSNSANDNRAITIEVSNCENGGDWRVSDEVLAKLIDLCVDICQRNDIKKLNFTGDKSGNLTMHKWFAATGCPGPYLESKFPYIAEEVNKRLGQATTATTTKPAEPAKPTTQTKSIEELAREVIAGKHGNGSARKKSLGDLYDEVQARVTELMGKSTTTTTKPAETKPVEEQKIVHTVVKGDSLWNIAAKYLGKGNRYPEIVKLNGLKSTVLRIGQKLTIPKK